jgi:dolichol-phosphate mannosyltransferase
MFRGFGHKASLTVRVTQWASEMTRLQSGRRTRLSGFLMCRREVFEQALRRMSGQVFKILLDLFASSPEPVRVCELTYSFRHRQHG